MVWAATAALHRKHGASEAFSSQRIHDQVRELGFHGIKDRTIKNNITTYCVGNHLVASSYKSTSTYKHCKLFKKDGKYRLWRSEDEPKRDPDRNGGQVEPEEDPPGCKGYIKWYRNKYKNKALSPPNVLNGSIPSINRHDRQLAIQSDHDQTSKVTDGKSDTRVDLNGVTEYESIGIVVLTGTESDQPSKAIEVVTRFVRDHKKVKHVKSLYRDRCQVCGYSIRTPTGAYSEVHHLHPLGEGGVDDNTNMLVLCPTHHVEFDYAVIGISDDGLSLIDMDGKIMRKLSIPLKHPLDQKNIKHHLGRMRRVSSSMNRRG